MQISVETAAALKALRAYPKEMQKAIKGALNEVTRKQATAARREFKSTRPGRSIFSFKGGRGTPPLKVTRRSARLSQSQHGYVVELKIEGMAALIEEGGRTKPPRNTGGKIFPVRRKVLRFDGRRGTAFAPSVQHPGSRVRKNPIGHRALQRSAQVLPPVMDAALQSAAKAVGL